MSVGDRRGTNICKRAHVSPVRLELAGSQIRRLRRGANQHPAAHSATFPVCISVPARSLDRQSPTSHSNQTSLIADQTCDRCPS